MKIEIPDNAIFWISNTIAPNGITNESSKRILDFIKKEAALKTTPTELKNADTSYSLDN